jgi:hypothetical protein
MDLQYAAGSGAAGHDSSTRFDAAVSPVSTLRARSKYAIRSGRPLPQRYLDDAPQLGAFGAARGLDRDARSK